MVTNPWYEMMDFDNHGWSAFDGSLRRVLTLDGRSHSLMLRIFVREVLKLMRSLREGAFESRALEFRANRDAAFNVFRGWAFDGRGDEAWVVIIANVGRWPTLVQQLTSRGMTSHGQPSALTVTSRPDTPSYYRSHGRLGMMMLMLPLSDEEETLEIMLW